MIAVRREREGVYGVGHKPKRISFPQGNISGIPLFPV